MKGTQYYRNKIAEPKLQFAARTEFAKIGFDIDSEVLNAADTTSQGSKATRSNMRRALNQVQDQVRDGKIPLANKDGTPNKSIDDAIAWAGAVIGLLSEEIDMEENGGGASHGHSSQNEAALRDKDGKRIGTLLSNQTLKDGNRIAASLKVNSSADDPSLSEFFRGVAGMKTASHVRNALSEGTDSAGGYTVPTVLLPGILAAMVPASSMLQAGANIAVLTDPGKSFNIAGISSIPTAAWRSESGNVAESDPAFRSITVTPRSLAFRFKVSRELLQDSTNIEQSLRIAVASAFAKELDRAGLRGTGTAPEIRGLLNTVGVNAIGNGVNGSVLADYTKFINSARQIKSFDAPPPTAAIMSLREDESVALFADTTGQPLRRPDALAGWQFLTTSQIPTNLTVGTSTDCSEMYVGDFRNFVFYMREGVSIQMVTELYAQTGEIGFICHTRVDVAALYPQAFAVVTGVR